MLFLVKLQTAVSPTKFDNVVRERENATVQEESLGEVSLPAVSFKNILSYCHIVNVCSSHIYMTHSKTYQKLSIKKRNFSSKALKPNKIYETH
jgi:hypothetical protein